LAGHAVVIGSGIAGLFTALALAPAGWRVTLLDRDGPPPEGGADEAFATWQRRGVGQLRQSHAFLARLRMVLKREHPGLLQTLLDNGVRELGFQMMLSPQQEAGYRPAPEDADLAVITSRRTTLELLIRRYAGTLPGVTVRSGFMVRGLDVATSSGAPLVTGVHGEEDGADTHVTGDIVVDASGKTGATLDQLAAIGVGVTEDSVPEGPLYYTRHYRFRDGQSEPPRPGPGPATGDLGFLKFGVFPADNGCFSITLCAPEDETELRKAIVHPDVFQRITQLIPGLAPWTDPGRAAAVGKVYSMGNLFSRWRSLVKDGRASVRGYFAIGDALVRTNPLYGRGCSFAAASAWALRDALAGAGDPREALPAYEAALRRELRPYFDTMRQQDRSAMRRARRLLQPPRPETLRGRMIRSFVDDGVTIALRRDTGLLRAALRGFHMLEHPNAWLMRPANLARVLLVWLRGRKANAAWYPPPPGPDRSTMLCALGLDPAKDMLAGA
jgi:2-polyprenyl-6-methoxyphenol hydroxylase-like FAD-dependent oxidoreductase